MSGIYIPGMEMPTTGEYRCVIRKWDEEITIDLYGDEELCGKLVPVPDHGDLIDRGALKENWFFTELGNKVVDAGEIDAAPTIIPADKEETE